MTVHRLCRTAQRNYLRDVERVAIWLEVEQSEIWFGAAAMNNAVSALRSFYTERSIGRI